MNFNRVAATHSLVSEWDDDEGLPYDYDNLNTSGVVSFGDETNSELPETNQSNQTFTDRESKARPKWYEKECLSY